MLCVSCYKLAKKIILRRSNTDLVGTGQFTKLTLKKRNNSLRSWSSEIDIEATNTMIISARESNLLKMYN